MTFTSRKPKSFYVFVGAIALGLFVFVPVAFAGLSFRGIPWFLTGMAGAGLSWLIAAFVGMFLASRAAQGHYETLRPTAWREQVWVLLVAIAAPLAFMPQHADAQYPLARAELRTCMDRDASLNARQDNIEIAKRGNDIESDAIARAGERLAGELRSLDSTNSAAVEDYNARTAAHNHRVEIHNRRVSEMNAAAAALNADQADMSASCGTRSYYPYDRDAILRERGWR